MNDMGLHFLAKMKILVVKDIEREDIEFISKVVFFAVVFYHHIDDFNKDIFFFNDNYICRLLLWYVIVKELCYS